MIGRFLGFATDTASSVLNLFGRSDIQQASVERTAAYFGAVDEAADEVMGPADLGPYTIDAVFAEHRRLWDSRPTPDELFDGWPFPLINPKTSAASNPPGASDAGPEQVPPLQPAPGLPDPSCTIASASCAVHGEGPADDSDIPPVAAAGQPTSETCLCGHWVHVGNPCSACGCLVRMVQAMPTTPDTADLNGDLETELALANCEVEVLKRRLGYAKSAFKFVTGHELEIPIGATEYKSTN